MNNGTPSVTRTVLLDTNALLWAVEGHERLGRDRRDLADSALRSDSLFVSAISFWEVAMLAIRRRVTLAYPSGEWRRNALGIGITELPLTGEIGILAAELDGLPGDPADRMITATALLRGHTLLTADERILGWSGNVLRQDART